MRTPTGVGGVKTPVKHPPSGAAKSRKFSQNQKSNAQNHASFRKIKNQTRKTVQVFAKSKIKRAKSRKFSQNQKSNATRRSTYFSGVLEKAGIATIHRNNGQGSFITINEKYRNIK